MAYTVLARRYRSQTFDDVVGQDAVAQTLKNAIKGGKVAHAYLFTGTRGVGKTTMARILAKSLNCLESDEPTIQPCCKCDSCVSVNIGEDIDVIEIDGASNTGVDNIRQLRQNAIYRPARGRYKIYIIDEVHMLSTGAFNALLKILEEPPDHVKFIFATTEPNKVLPTIQSRCQRFDFGSIAPAVISSQLKSVLKSEKIKFEDDLLLGLSRLANGSMRDALSLLDQLISAGTEPLTLDLLEEFLGEPNREKICSLIDNIGDKDAGGVLNAVDQLLKTGQSPIQIAAAIIDCMRDMIVIKSSDSKSELLVLTAQERQRMAGLAEKFDTPALIYNITTLERLRWTIKNSDNPRAVLEASMLRLALSEHFLSIPALLARLSASNTGAQSATVRSGVNVKKKFEPPLPAPAAPAPGKIKAPKAPAQSTESPIAQTSVPIGDLNKESIISNWPGILASLHTKETNTASLLDSAIPTDWHNNILTLTFPPSEEFAMSGCQRRSERIQTFLAEITGTEVKVKFEKGTAIAAAAKPPGAKTSKTERDKILSDPAVKKLLTGLNATVTQIDEIRDD